jgi:hypothetical protein
MMDRHKLSQKKEGFVIIVSLIVTVIVLGVGIGIISITLKDYVFSGIVFQSHKAFYVADTGLDCALSYDLKGSFAPLPTPPTDPDTFTVGAGPISSISCGGQNLTPYKECGQSGSSRYCEITFENTSDEACFKVNVKYSLDHKNTEEIDDDEEVVSIQSRGWNTCDENNLRRVERALELTYGQAS